MGLIIAGVQLSANNNQIQVSQNSTSFDFYLGQSQLSNASFFDLEFDKVLRLRYPNRTMIQNVFGIKEFQTKLPAMARLIEKEGGHYIVTCRNKPVFVVMPFADYQDLEDILMELNSPQLLRDVAQARKDYKAGKTKTLDEVLKSLK